MAEITTFKKNWTPSEFVLMSRLATSSGAPTFALAWDNGGFPEVFFFQDVPLGWIRKNVVTAARYQRRMARNWSRQSWTRALEAALTTTWAKSDPLERPFIERHGGTFEAKQHLIQVREFRAAGDWFDEFAQERGGLDAVLVSLRSGALDLSDDE